MPKTINPIKKAIVKRELKKGNSARKALFAANYSPGTIRKSTFNKVVKTSMEELGLELKASDLTPDIIIDGLNDIRKLCIKGKKKDLSSAVRIHELYGKYLKMWSDTSNPGILVTFHNNQFTLQDRVKQLKEGKE